MGTVNLVLNKLFGLRADDSGSTSLKKGELSQIQNFKIIEGYHARKRTGYSAVLSAPFANKIDGMWAGKINGYDLTIIAVNGSIRIVHEDGTTTEIGTMAAGKTNFFFFNNALYIQNGVEFKKFTAEVYDVPVETLFDSTSYAGTYPATATTLTTGIYTVEMKGGKGADSTWGSLTAKGGKGGTLKFKIALQQNDAIAIDKVNGSGKGIKFSKNNTLISVVGGGGQSGGMLLPNAATAKGGDGGGDIGENGASVVGGAYTAAGTGAVKNIGGTSYGKPATNPTNGGNAPNGIGGQGTYGSTDPCSGTLGGGGYAGGGGGAGWNTTYVYGINAAGGGSSFLIDTINAIENSRGTNDAAESIKVFTTEQVFYSIAEVEGYIPKISVSSKPDGSNSTAYEGLNALTGKKRKTFNGDNTSTVFYLPETNVDSIDKVLVGGVLKTLTTHYTVNLAAGTVTFTTGNTPPTGIDNVEIYWKKGNGDRTAVTKYLYSKLYGGKNDNRVFMYGTGNRIIYSGLADGVPSAEYFPVLNTLDIGSSQFDVTDLTVQYDRMLIHKEVGTWWTQYEFNTTLGVNFPVYPLNDAVGCTPKGQAQIALNNPIIIYGKRVYQFVASNVRDERNAKYMSERVQPLLNELDLSNALTLDYEKDGEYWIVIENRVYIYNYHLDVWYYYYLADTITALSQNDETVIFGTLSGQIMKFDASLTDNGTLINAFLETGFIDYGYGNISKFINFMWVQIFPEYDTSADVYIQLDYAPPKLVKTISYKNTAFDDMDFEDFALDTNYNPKGVRLKPKAKKFVYIKFIVENKTDNRLTLLGITAPAILGGLSK